MKRSIIAGALAFQMLGQAIAAETKKDIKVEAPKVDVKTQPKVEQKVVKEEIAQAKPQEPKKEPVKQNKAVTPPKAKPKVVEKISPPTLTPAAKEKKVTTAPVTETKKVSPEAAKSKKELDVKPTDTPKIKEVPHTKDHPIEAAQAAEKLTKEEQKELEDMNKDAGNDTGLEDMEDPKMDENDGMTPEEIAEQKKFDEEEKKYAEEEKANGDGQDAEDQSGIEKVDISQKQASRQDEMGDDDAPSADVNDPQAMIQKMMMEGGGMGGAVKVSSQNGAMVIEMTGGMGAVQHSDDEDGDHNGMPAEVQQMLQQMMQQGGMAAGMNGGIIMGGSHQHSPTPILNADDLNTDMETKNSRFEDIKKQQAKNKLKFGSGMSTQQYQVYAVFAFFMIATVYIIVQSFRINDDDAQLDAPKKKKVAPPASKERDE